MLFLFYLLYSLETRHCLLAGGWGTCSKALLSICMFPCIKAGKMIKSFSSEALK